MPSASKSSGAGRPPANEMTSGRGPAHVGGAGGKSRDGGGADIGWGRHTCPPYEDSVRRPGDFTMRSPFFIARVAAIVTIRGLIRRAWFLYRWDTRPPQPPLP